MRQHQAMVFSLACYFLRDRAAAEELAQDVFLQLYRCLDRLQSPEHVVFWLRRVTANRCIQEARRRQRRPEVPLEEVPCPPAPDEDPLLREHLRRLVASLPPKTRMLVLLRYQEDLDPKDIAEVMQMPVNTVKSTLHRTLTILRQKAGALVLEK
jgi:RNA polymerase sigma-70 factor (ECF subfamily)